jgi:hypothetical protein
LLERQIPDATGPKRSSEAGEHVVHLAGAGTWSSDAHAQIASNWFS